MEQIRHSEDTHYRSYGGTLYYLVRPTITLHGQNANGENADTPVAPIFMPFN
jgi:hypothetical protein